jgi:hypothetical protein
MTQETILRNVRFFGFCWHGCSKMAIGISHEDDIILWTMPGIVVETIHIATFHCASKSAKIHEVMSGGISHLTKALPPPQSALLSTVLVCDQNDRSHMGTNPGYIVDIASS